MLRSWTNMTPQRPLPSYYLHGAPVSPRTLAYAPGGPLDADFGTGRTAFDNATTAQSRRLIALSVAAEAIADAAERELRSQLHAGIIPPPLERLRLGNRRTHFRLRAHALWTSALKADPVLAARYR
jgi:hypothetical protein